MDLVGKFSYTAPKNEKFTGFWRRNATLLAGICSSYSSRRSSSQTANMRNWEQDLSQEDICNIEKNIPAIAMLVITEVVLLVGEVISSGALSSRCCMCPRATSLAFSFSNSPLDWNISLRNSEEEIIDLSCCCINVRGSWGWKLVWQ